MPSNDEKGFQLYILPDDYKPLEDNKISIDPRTIAQVVSYGSGDKSVQDYIDETVIPTKVSELENDSGFITDDYHDNTKQDSLPSGNVGQILKKTADGVEWSDESGGTVKSVNNETPDENGNISLSIPTITDTYSSTSTDGMSGKAVASAISGKQDKLTPGANIKIENNVISATGGLSEVAWGGITGTLANQTDLQNALNDKQDALPEGTTGYYLKKTDSSVEWAEVTPGTDVEELTDTEIETTWNSVKI